MSKSPILALSRMNVTFHVSSDASQEAVGTALTQKDDQGKIRAVQFASRNLTNVKRRYSTFKTEAVVIIFALRPFRHHLLSSPFVVYSDYSSLKSAIENSDIHGRLPKWLDLMAEHEFKIQHIDGKRNVSADYLFRFLGNTGDFQNESKLSIDTFLNGDTK